MSVKAYSLLALLILIGQMQVATAKHLEAQMYVITDWVNECSANDVSHWDNMITLWYNEIDNHGWYHQGHQFINGDINSKLFCDPDTNIKGCNDAQHIDSADVAMLGFHGADLNNHWQGNLRRKNANTAQPCKINAAEKAGGKEMMVGDWNMEFLHLSSPNSMDDDNIPSTHYLFSDPSDSQGNSRRLHQANGFHGFMWVGHCCDKQYEDFANDAFAVSIRESWMDNMFASGINGNSTQCPVAYGIGKNRKDCFNRLDNERYNNIFPDPKEKNYYCYYYYDGCNPEGETAFTNPNS
ncbi:MAG: hypothetical protein KAH22_07695 [Thiotrichaceae bacterium]|nr:hypothetical protein [Thiotrichaceae bacterium]